MHGAQALQWPHIIQPECTTRGWTEVSVYLHDHQPSAPYPSVINHQHRIHQSPTLTIRSINHITSHFRPPIYRPLSSITWAVQATRTAQCLIPQAWTSRKGGLRQKETSYCLRLAWANAEGVESECLGV